MASAPHLHSRSIANLAQTHRITKKVLLCCTARSRSRLRRNEHCTTNCEHAFRSPGLAIGETRDDGMQVLKGKDRFRPKKADIESDHS